MAKTRARSPRARKSSATDNVPLESQLLEEVNAFLISKGELLQYSEECNRVRLPEGEDGPNTFIAATMVATRLSKGSENPHVKAMALWSRMSACARMGREGARGWVLEHRAPDGMRLIEEAMFTAAAVEPLVKGDDGEFTFDRESFLQHVLEVAERESAIQ